MWTAGAVVQGLVLLAVVASAGTWWGLFELRWWVLVLAALAAAAYAAVMPSWRYAVHRWEVTDSAVYTQTGWWAVEQRIAPMSRIQTVDYEEHLVGRLFGLAAVTVTTASAAGALEINGLDTSVARDLVGLLTERADAVPGDAT